jgi:hypothetical protein
VEGKLRVVVVVVVVVGRDSGYLSRPTDKVLA